MNKRLRNAKGQFISSKSSSQIKIYSKVKKASKNLLRNAKGQFISSKKNSSQKLPSKITKSKKLSSKSVKSSKQLLRNAKGQFISTKKAQTPSIPKKTTSQRLKQNREKKAIKKSGIQQKEISFGNFILNTASISATYQPSYPIDPSTSLLNSKLTNQILNLIPSSFKYSTFATASSKVEVVIAKKDLINHKFIYFTFHFSITSVILINQKALIDYLYEHYDYITTKLHLSRFYLDYVDLTIILKY